MDAITNIAAYKFARLAELKPLRERLLRLCRGWGLKGTILLSTEGINLFVAGSAASIDLLLHELRSIPGLAELTPKISESDHQPFSRMLVRIKKEIIAFGVEGIDPATRTSPKLDARTLKQWLDEGRPLTLLDTRNDYEVKLGTFKGALPIGVNHFRDFPAAVDKLPGTMREQPIVMFCTGGIRCEKAGPFMESRGFRQIFQLDGGILKYFEECGAAHYEGECFVFDQRVGVDPSLHETESTQCFNCLTPLTQDQQEDPRYQPPVSCPYCFRTTEERQAAELAVRQQAISQACHPLPGSTPYDNYRPLNVPPNLDGMTVVEFVARLLPHVPLPEWEQIGRQGRLVDVNRRSVAPTHPVRAGERYWHWIPETIEPPVSSDIRLVHEDEALIVIHKPAPLPLHPCGRFNRNTLQHIIQLAYQPQKPRPAHRLDANTTGLVVFTRTRAFASLLQPQFARGQVEKRYLARVQGHPPEDRFACDAAISDEPGDLGAREVDEENGLEARTEFTVLERLADGTSLIEARPLTGRTNQIRVHLWELGFPICGDPVYLPNRGRGTTQTLSLTDPPLCLHAWKLGFKHPVTRQPVEFTAPQPSWAAEAAIH
jgi:UPF0176 protein